MNVSRNGDYFEIPMARIASVVADIVMVASAAGTTVPENLQSAFAGKGLPEFKRLVDQLEADNTITPPAATYIPTLRGLRAVSRAGGSITYNDGYSDATRQDYGLDASVHVETGLALYEDLRKHLLGKRDERARVRAYEDFLSRTFFDNVPVTLTPHEGEQALRVDLGGDEHPIHHVGDGLQSVIVMTYRAFMTRGEPGLFFIEEPELFLHPGMQRRLLHFFLHETPHLYFLTTHSNHLLDLSMDERGITVYNFHRAPKEGADGKSEAAMVTRVERVNGGDRSSLALLGVRAPSVFLVNATVWVEGITDRLYLREMLRLYVESKKGDEGFRRMEEDAHYSFVEYAGSNITHWSFLKNEPHPIEVERLCGHAMLLVDEDGSATSDKGKAKRIEELRAAIGDRLLVTYGREVENMLPEQVIEAVLRHFEGPKAVLPPIDRGAYRNELLGGWLDKLLGADKQREGDYGDKSGTVAQKGKFCAIATDAMRQEDFTFADLPAEVRAMVERIYAFIKEQNR